MTGDGIRELELRPVFAFVLDEPLALRVFHAQRQRCGANVHDLASLAVETERYVIVLADKKPVSEPKDDVATCLHLGFPRLWRVQARLQRAIERGDPGRRVVLRAGDLGAEADSTLDYQPLGVRALVLGG